MAAKRKLRTRKARRVSPDVVAPKRSSRARKTHAVALVLCLTGDDSCVAKAQKKGLAVGLMPTIDPYVPEGFNYTTPSVFRGREGGKPPSAKTKREYGCLTEVRDYKSGPTTVFTGKVRRGGKVFKDSFCSTASSYPCSTSRFEKPPASGSCPVQLVYVEGTPALRLCEGPRKSGRIVKAKSTADLMKQAKAACTHWKKNVSWDGFHVTKPRDGGIGRTRRKKRKR